MRTEIGDHETSAPIVLLGIGSLYVAQSVVGGLTWTAMPAIMRDAGVALDRIGLVWLIALPWAVKFLWAPMIELLRLPAAGGDRSKSIVGIGGGCMVAGLATAAMVPPSNFPVLFGTLLVVAFVTATVDIACDGFAVQSLAKRLHGWGNAAQVGGAYLGSAIGGGFILVLMERVGWSTAILCAAVMLALLFLPFLAIRSPMAQTGERSHLPSIGNALGRSSIRRGLLLGALYIIALKLPLAMLGPFLIDSGVSLARLGLLSGIASLTLGLASALAGGALARALGLRGLMMLALFLQATSLALVSYQAKFASLPLDLVLLVALISSSAILALGFVGLYAQFMRWSDPRQGGVDFTLFQCMDALVSMAGGAVAGLISAPLGYGTLFLASTILTLMLIVPIWKIADRA